jgi:hypothetical protein
MADTIAITKTNFDELLKRVKSLEDSVLTLTKIIKNMHPKTGSVEWWEKGIRESRKAYDQGGFVEFDSTKTLSSYLNSLK